MLAAQALAVPEVEYTQASLVLQAEEYIQASPALQVAVALQAVACKLVPAVWVAHMLQLAAPV